MMSSKQPNTQFSASGLMVSFRDEDGIRVDIDLDWRATCSEREQVNAIVERERKRLGRLVQQDAPAAKRVRGCDDGELFRFWAYR